jgi:hypothetical protein
MVSSFKAPENFDKLSPNADPLEQLVTNCPNVNSIYFSGFYSQSLEDWKYFANKIVDNETWNLKLFPTCQETPLHSTYHICAYYM